jgi:hypothetical protein
MEDNILLFLLLEELGQVFRCDEERSNARALDANGPRDTRLEPRVTKERRRDDEREPNAEVLEAIRNERAVVDRRII